LPPLVPIPKEEIEQSKVYVRFIDILYAVVVGQSFVFLSSRNFLNLTTLLDIVLGYAVVITSWIGYHTSTRKLPIRNILRFAVDVVLLFLYYLIFVNVESFTMVVAILTFVFGLFLLWEVIRLFEYIENLKELDLGRRTAITAGFLIGFIFLTIAVAFNKDLRMQGAMWEASFGLLVLFRYYSRGGPKKRRTTVPPSRSNATISSGSA
jgi:hypothetical protein